MDSELSPLLNSLCITHWENYRSQTLPTDSTDEPFFVIKSNAPAPVWEVKRNGDGLITEIRHRKSWPYVRHFFFHLIDQEWGHVTIRMCGYPPFGAQVILNGGAPRPAKAGRGGQERQL